MPTPILARIRRSQNIQYVGLRCAPQYTISSKKPRYLYVLSQYNPGFLMSLSPPFSSWLPVYISCAKHVCGFPNALHLLFRRTVVSTTQRQQTGHCVRSDPSTLPSCPTLSDPSGRATTAAHPRHTISRSRYRRSRRRMRRNRPGNPWILHLC